MSADEARLSPIGWLGRRLQNAVRRHRSAGTEGLRLLEGSCSAAHLAGGANGLLDVLGEHFRRGGHAGVND
jgi:hypothetical protein